MCINHGHYTYMCKIWSFYNQQLWIYWGTPAPPYGSQFFHFVILFFLNLAASGVRAALWGGRRVPGNQYLSESNFLEHDFPGRTTGRSFPRIQFSWTYFNLQPGISCYCMSVLLSLTKNQWKGLAEDFFFENCLWIHNTPHDMHKHIKYPKYLYWLFLSNLSLQTAWWMHFKSNSQNENFNNTFSLVFSLW